MLRTFIAVNLTEEALQACQAEAERLREAMGASAKELRFARPEGLHLTLKFLGQTPEEKVPELTAALARAAKKVKAFTAVVEGFACFPNPRKPRVLFLDISEGAAPLVELAKYVEEEVAPLGWPTEKRGFTPHLTVARTREMRGSANVGAKLAGYQPEVRAPFPVGAVTLMRSQLNPKGSIYTELSVAPLAT